MEAWEHIAPELPPGALQGRDRVWFCFQRHNDAAGAWGSFELATEMDRKRYAELIAVERVREAAEAKHGRSALDGVIVIAKIHPESCVFEIVWRDALSVYKSEYSGPTLCDAAWECIQALGGGE